MGRRNVRGVASFTPWPSIDGKQGWRQGMLWTIAVILLVLWLLGFGFHVAGGLIHILLVIAVIVVVVQLISGRRV